MLDILAQPWRAEEEGALLPSLLSEAVALSGKQGSSLHSTHRKKLS